MILSKYLGMRSVRIILYTLGFAIGSEIIYAYAELWMKRTKKIIKDIRKLSKPIQEEKETEIFFENEKSFEVIKCGGFVDSKSGHICKYDYCYLKLHQRMLKHIYNAKYSIDLAMYLLHSPELREALVAATLDGVRVRLIGDSKEAFTCDMARISCDFGIPLRYISKDRSLMHHKFCLIDSDEEYCRKRHSDKICDKLINRANRQTNENEDSDEDDESLPRSILITGSMNWTFSGLISNFENVILTSDPGIVKKYQDEFNRLWESINRNSEMTVTESLSPPL